MLDVERLPAPNIMHDESVGPRRVVCVVDHLGRDRHVADDACRHVFTHCALTLDLSDCVDWSANQCDDEEWRIEWVKMYEGLNLAHAFAMTGDARYLNTWQDLVHRFCDQVPVGQDSSDVSARRVQNWIYAWCRFADAPAFRGLRPGLAQRLRERISLDADHIRHHLTAERNHRTLELYALFIVALALPHTDPCGELAQSSLTELGANLQIDVWPDGVHRECSTDYHHIVLRSFVGVVANASRFGLVLPNGFRERLHRACDFALHVQRPDGTTPSLSDGDVGAFSELLTMAGDVLDRPDLTWAGSSGRHGIAPRRLDATFSTGGYVTQRSGWGASNTPYADERFLVLDCGPLGDGGHGHYDQLSVEMAGAGGSIAVDPGRFTYAEEPAGWRRWFKGTAAHNTVTVDGLDQMPYRRGKPKGPMPSARLVSRDTTESLDLIVAQASSPQYAALHTRRIAFVGRDYWIVHDHLRDIDEHLYEARWHLPPEVSDLRILQNDSAVLVCTSVATFAVPDGLGNVSIEDGWVSPQYGVKSAAPVITVRTRAARADLVTVVVPGTQAVTVRADVDPQTGTLTAHVTRGSNERHDDRIVWSPIQSLLRIDHVQARCRALWQRSDRAQVDRDPSWVVVE